MYVTSAGIQFQTQTSAAGSLGTLHDDPATGLLYSDTGKVLDPKTGAVLQSFPLNVVQGGFNPSVMVPDGKLNIAYFLGTRNFDTVAGDYVLEAFDLTHFTFLGAIPIARVSGSPTKMFRWGSNGLAFLTDNAVYLVSGGFVTSPAS